jgi:hypothetical protein
MTLIFHPRTMREAVFVVLAKPNLAAAFEFRVV